MTSLFPFVISLAHALMNVTGVSIGSINSIGKPRVSPFRFLNLDEGTESAEIAMSEHKFNRNYSAILATLQITSYVHSRNSS